MESQPQVPYSCKGISRESVMEAPWGNYNHLLSLIYGHLD